MVHQKNQAKLNSLFLAVAAAVVLYCLTPRRSPQLVLHLGDRTIQRAADETEFHKMKDAARQKIQGSVRGTAGMLSWQAETAEFYAGSSVVRDDAHASDGHASSDESTGVFRTASATRQASRAESTAETPNSAGASSWDDRWQSIARNRRSQLNLLQQQVDHRLAKVDAAITLHLPPAWSRDRNALWCMGIAAGTVLLIAAGWQRDRSRPVDLAEGLDARQYQFSHIASRWLRQASGRSLVVLAIGLALARGAGLIEPLLQ